MSAAKGGMTVALISPVKSCLWLRRVSRETDAVWSTARDYGSVLAEYGRPNAHLYLLPSCAGFLDLLRLGAPWKRVSLQHLSHSQCWQYIKDNYLSNA